MPDRTGVECEYLFKTTVPQSNAECRWRKSTYKITILTLLTQNAHYCLIITTTIIIIQHLYSITELEDTEAGRTTNNCPLSTVLKHTFRVVWLSSSKWNQHQKMLRECSADFCKSEHTMQLLVNSQHHTSHNNSQHTNTCTWCHLLITQWN